MRKTIGLTLICTGLYDRFLQPLITSVDTHFFPKSDIIIYLFGDKDFYQLKLPKRISLVIIPTEHKPWPASTLFRYRHITEVSNKMKICQYIAYCDVDMMLVGTVSEDILDDDSELYVTRHPGFWNNSDWGSHGVPMASKAYLPDNLKERYVAGGFNLGKTDKFLEMSRILADNIDDDYSRGLIAVHNDETHLNKFVNDIVKFQYKDWKVKDLTPSYCMLTDKDARIKFGLTDLEPIIYCIEKNHEELRKH